MKGKEIIEKGDVLIENNRIKKVGKSGEIKNNNSIKEIDLTERNEVK